MTSDIVSAMEVGTTRTVLAAGCATDEGVRLLAFAEQETTGMRKGRVAEPDYVASAVRTVREQAEAQLGGSLVDTALVCSLGDISCDPVDAEVPVAGDGGRVDADDVRRVREALASAVPDAPGRVRLGGTMSLYYTLDGGSEEILEPVDMSASRLGMRGMAVSTDQIAWDRLADAVGAGGLDVNFEVFSGFAAATGALSRQKMEDGALCICLGGGTTVWSAWHRRHPIAAGALPVGGDHVTNDLLSAFRPGSVMLAGRLKTECGRADAEEVDPSARVAMPQEVGGPGRTVSARAVAQVVTARMDETLRLVRADLEARGVLPWIGGGVVLAGGGALMPGVTTLVSRMFGAPCSVAELRTGIDAIDRDGARNATIWGALCKAIRHQRVQAAHEADGGVRGFFRKIFSREGDVS